MQSMAVALAGCVQLRPRVGKRSIYLTSPYLEDDGRLIVFDLKKKEMRTVKLGIRFAHGYAQNPISPSHAICISPHQEKFSVVDLDSAKLIAQPQTKNGNKMIAHAAFSFAGEKFYTGEMSSNGGVIGVYDSYTYKRIGEFPSHGGGPHDMVMLNREELLVSDYSESYKTSSLTILNVDTGKVKIDIPLKEKDQQWGHLCKVDDRVFVNTQHYKYKNKEKFNEFMAKAQPWEANKWRETFASPSFVLAKEELIKVPFDPELHSWSRMGFSTGISGDQKLAASTFGLDNAIGVYSLNEPLLVKKIAFSHGPQGVSPSWERGFLVSTGDKKLWQLEPGDFTPRFLADLPVGDHSAMFMI